MWVAVGIFSLLWLLSSWFAGYVGYKLRTINDRVAKLTSQLQEVLARKRDKPESQEKQRSSIIDPSDIYQVAQFEQDEIQRRLNP